MVLSRCGLAIAVLASRSIVLAQSRTAAFEVASIKANPAGITMVNGKPAYFRRAYSNARVWEMRGIAGNRLAESAVTLTDLIIDA